MSVYGELDPIVEHRTQFTFKSNRKHIEEANTKDIAYWSQHIDIEIPLCSKDHVIVPDTVKSTDKASGVVNNVGRALVKKKGSHAWLKKN